MGSFLTVPGFVLGYGVVRMIDGHDGQYGQGLAWTVGPVMFLVCLLWFGVVIAGLRHRVPPGGTARRVVADVVTILGLAGLLMFVRVAVVDMVVGLRAADSAQKSALSDQYEDWPESCRRSSMRSGRCFSPSVLLAVAPPRRVPWWAPVALAEGFAAIIANLDLLPLGAIAIGLALVPASRSTTRAEPTRSPRRTRTGVESATPPTSQRTMTSAAKDHVEDVRQDGGNGEAAMSSGDTCRNVLGAAVQGTARVPKHLLDRHYIAQAQTPDARAKVSAPVHRPQPRTRAGSCGHGRSRGVVCAVAAAALPVAELNAYPRI